MRKELPPNPSQDEILESLQARVEEIRATLPVGPPPPRILTIEAGVPYPIRVQLTPTRCWKCGQRIKAARGYIFTHEEVPDEPVFIALEHVTDTRQLTALISNLRKQDPAITPVGFNYSKTMGKQYFSARCPHCSFLCGSFFMTNTSFFPERALCDYPECECCYNPDTHCHGSEYHELRLRLGDFEISEIKMWLRVPDDSLNEDE
jgi:hypothetical protein